MHLTQLKPLLLVTLITLIAGCGSFEGFGTSSTTGQDGELGFSTPRTGDVIFDTPVAVDATLELHVTRHSSNEFTIESAYLDDPDVFDIIEEYDQRLVLQAIGAGESELVVSGVDEDGEVVEDRVVLRAEVLAHATLHPKCGEDSLHLVDKSYTAQMKFFDDEGNQLKGADLVPFDIPSGQLTLEADDEKYMGALIHTGDTPGLVEVASAPGGDPSFIELITSDEADSIAVSTVISGKSDEEQQAGITWHPDDNPILAVERLRGDRLVCETEVSYRFTVQTPDICELISGDSPTEVITDIPVFAPHFLATGQCDIEIEALHHPQPDELIEVFSWTVEAPQ